MKLAASVFCVAALALVGCVDEAATGGGQGEGIYPSKISLENPNEPKPFDPGDVTSYKQKLGSAPADAVCDGCVMDSYRVIDTSAGIDEVRVVSDGGMELCRIYLDDNGGIVLDDCGWIRP